MTCRCGYQFCYVCGQSWGDEHVCNQYVGEGAENYDNYLCCDCSCCDCCGPFACIFKFPIQLVVQLLFLFMMLLVFMTQFMFIICIFLFTFFPEMLFFSFDYICTLLNEGNTLLACILLLFFPIAMIIGIGIAIRDVAWDMVSGMCR